MAGDEQQTTLLQEKELRAFCNAVLVEAGVPEQEADLINAILIEADLRGVASHGVVRFPIYVDRILAGVVNSRPAPKLLRETATTGVLDGDNGMGQLVGHVAMKIASDKAERAQSPAFVTVRGSNHYGAAAYFAQMAAARNMVGFSYTIGGINHMAPWGGAEPLLGNNPFAIAMPAGREHPIVLDMACSVAARGKIIVAAKTGDAIPEGWATDSEGRPTTDPVEALKGLVLPVGGPKGYALTLMVGLLSTMLSDAFFGSEVTHMYEDLEHEQNIGHLMGVLPVTPFCELEQYSARMEKAVRELRSVRPAPGTEQVYLPGEREYLLLDQRRREGIPISRAVVAELEETGRKLGVELARFVGGTA